MPGTHKKTDPKRIGIEIAPERVIDRFASIGGEIK
jgi:hypothetical protein